MNSVSHLRFVSIFCYLKHKICIRRKPRSVSTFVLILTPEMLEELESRPKHYLHDLVSSYHKKVLVFYDSRDFQNCGVCRTLDYHCPEILKWKKFKTGNNDTNFWQMCFEMFNMTNMKDQSFKLMPKRIWMVSSCTFRNKIYL